MTFRRVALINPGGKKGLGFLVDEIPIGLEYIAASLEEDVDEVHIVDMGHENHQFQYFLDTLNPELIGITMSATEHKEGLRLAEIAKKHGVATVLGGYHPTAIPEELLLQSYVDIIVRGEGELTMKELVQRGSPEGVLGLSYKKGGQIIHNPDRPLIEDLDSLPFPARHLRRIKYRNHMDTKNIEYDVITMSRGCWGRCSFCCEPYMSKGQMRFRSPSNVINELMEIIKYHKGKPLKIFVTDPHFMGDPKTIDQLCDLLTKHRFNVVFSVMTRVDSIVRHPELVKKMCDNGILIYELGFETPNLRHLQDVKKGITPETHRMAVQILRDNGAGFSGTFVIGLPGQTEEEIKEFPAYAKKIGLFSAAFGIATPFPGTEFYNELEKEGLIFENDWTKYDEMHSVFNLNPLSPQRLEELESYCMARFWTLKTLLDGTRVLQRRMNKEISLKCFIDDVIRKITFIENAGYDLREEDTVNHIKVVMDAMIDAEQEEKYRRIYVHDVLDVSRFLKILGRQKILVTVRCDEKTISYYFHTTGKSVDYEVFSGIKDDATININIDLNRALGSNKVSNHYNVMNYLFIFEQARSILEIWNLLRLCSALILDLSSSYLKNKLTVTT